MNELNINVVWGENPQGSTVGKQFHAVHVKHRIRVVYNYCMEILTIEENGKVLKFISPYNY